MQPPRHARARYRGHTGERSFACITGRGVESAELQGLGGVVHLHALHRGHEEEVLPVDHLGVGVVRIAAPLLGTLRTALGGLQLVFVLLHHLRVSRGEGASPPGTEVWAAARRLGGRQRAALLALLPRLPFELTGNVREAGLVWHQRDAVDTTLDCFYLREFLDILVAAFDYLPAGQRRA